jgi:methionyl aminopeptidase
MEKGLVICIEPMINLGRKETVQMPDGWTIKTIDGRPSAHFEYAVAVDRGRADVLTTFKFVEEVLNKM